MTGNLCNLTQTPRFSLKENNPFGGIIISAEVVMKVSGLHFETIQAIAREHGVDIKDKTCRCIDGKLLVHLKDAHVRKLRSYFNNVRQNISQLSGEELTTFIDFCKTFKRRQSKSWNDLLWNDINVRLIHERFIQSIQNLYYSSSDSCLGFLDRILLCGVCYSTPRVNHLPGDNQTDEERHRDFLLQKIYVSRPFSQPLKQSRIVPIVITSALRRIIITARYHIYVDDDSNNQECESIITLS